jgi:hypothetical protein
MGAASQSSPFSFSSVSSAGEPMGAAGGVALFLRRRRVGDEVAGHGLPLGGNQLFFDSLSSPRSVINRALRSRVK